MRIFSFWEPKEAIPAYLNLCMKTWEKFLPNSEVVILDYTSVRDYIDIDSYGPELFSGIYSLPQIADAIRCMLLEKYGGLWIDLDTIILSNKFVNYFKHSKECCFFGNPSARTVHIGVIHSIPNANLMRFWVSTAKEKIKNFREERDFWAYLGNSIIYHYVKEHEDEIKVLDVVKEKLMPEKYFSPSTISHRDLYEDFYFKKTYHLSDMQGVSAIMLHNSWTPNAFKKMSESEFLRYDCTLSNILAEIHGISCTKDRVWQISSPEKKVNEFKLIHRDGTIQYNPVINGLKVSFTGENGLVELYEPIGNFEVSSIICGTNSKVIIGGTSKSHARHGLNINARAKNNCCIIGKDFGCWGVSIGLLDEDNLSITIGDDCIFAGGIQIRPSDSHTILDKRTRLPLNMGEDIVIGNHVWIGQNVHIKKGVVIPDNSVVASFSCVSSKFTENNIVIAGVPAQIVRRNIDWDRRSPCHYLKENFAK